MAIDVDIEGYLDYKNVLSKKWIWGEGFPLTSPYNVEKANELIKILLNNKNYLISSDIINCLEEDWQHLLSEIFNVIRGITGEIKLSDNEIAILKRK